MNTRIRSRAFVRTALALLVLVAVLAVGTPARAGSIIFVAPGGAGTKTGADWANAKDLAAALAGASSGDELWVKKGAYKPDPTGLPDSRSATFNLKSGVAVYGGFAGAETQRSQRNWQANVTILSGDLNGDDTTSWTTKTDNSYNVVSANGVDASAILDGFTITASNFLGYAGGGVYNINGAGPTLSNLIITDNRGGSYGGGMYNENSTPTLTNITFDGNSVSNFGGGMYNTGPRGPTLTNVTFSSNSATGGGGMYNEYSDVKLTNVVFRGNSAFSSGAGMYNRWSNVTLVNGVFSGNAARGGGGIANYFTSPVLTNVTFSGNSASRKGGGIYNIVGSSPSIHNSILWGDSIGEIYSDDWSSSDPGYQNTPSVASSIVQGSGGSGSAWWAANVVTDGGNNLDADPKFITSVPATRPTTGGNLHLQPISPAINVGNNAYVPGGVTTDRDGLPRIAFVTVDMGAFEVQPYDVTYVAPTVGLPAANTLSGLQFALARWKMTDTSGQPVTTLGTVAAVKYTPMTCGGDIPAWNNAYPTADLRLPNNPLYNYYQKAWEFYWQPPTAKGCYALLIKLATSQVIPVLFTRN